MPTDPHPLAPLLNHIEGEGAIPPLEAWQPPLSGSMELRIGADGRWWHEGEPITRGRLIRLLSTVLRCEDDGSHYLVTPVEKWRIEVEDCAFLIIDADHQDGVWTLTTNVGDRLALGAERRLRLDREMPSVPVRFGLAARLHRNVYYRLIEQAESRSSIGGDVLELGVESDGVWQPLGRLSKEDA
ncbi:DUF1285 domain-containing protein [Halomonas sp. YLGW01]|uniref:DUF1285 domain-containing protein n=1 Tax=Halomonas sp. YLGW01 TaxID=2773308 RepID=UPI00177C0AAE|nr:DUF1285 domain-containing protein [Halomonas sp. YLGW01]